MFKTPLTIYWYCSVHVCIFERKMLNASRPSEHPPVRGENVKNLLMAFQTLSEEEEEECRDG